MSNVIEKLRKIGNRNYQTPREVLSDLYSKRDQNQVARVLGVAQSAISAAMRRLRITARPRRTPAPKGFVAQELTRRGRTTNRSARQMFASLYRTKGLSLQQIADQLGVNIKTVHTFAVERGINLRRVGRPRGKARSSRSFGLDGCL